MTISRKDFGLETHPLVSTLGTHRAYHFMVELNKEINFFSSASMITLLSIG